MIVSKEYLPQAIADIASESLVGFDTETYGVRFGDRMFALIVSVSCGEYYFNFNEDPDHLGKKPDANHVHTRQDILDRLRPLFLQGVWASHNATFDVQKLLLEDSECVPQNLHCTLATERVLRNDFMEYSLAATAKRYGMEKDGRVEEYVKKHGLTTKVVIPGKKKSESEKRYDLVPLEIMVEYGCKDAFLHRRIAQMQRHALGL